MFELATPYSVREGRRSQAARQPRRSQMSAVEIGQMSSVEKGQMSAAETGQMSAAETGQMSAVETRQMYSIGTGQSPGGAPKKICHRGKGVYP